MKTKKIITLAALTVFLAGISLAASYDREKYEEKFEKTVRLNKDGKVDLRNIAGDIEVKTWDKAEVRIDALKISREDSLEKAKENAGKVKIEVTEEGDALYIKTEYPKERIRSLNVSVDFWLTIPEGASININSVSGDVNAEKIGGALKAGSVSGEVTLMDIRGTLIASSISGNVTVEKAGSGADCKSTSGDVELKNIVGDVDLNSVSGDILVQDIKGSIDAETVSGDIELMNVADAQEVKVKALSGEIVYEGDIKSNGRYYLQSHSGDVTLLIPGSSAFDIMAKSFSGGIDSEFDITVSGKFGKEIKGSVNGGGAEVNIKTFSGTIDLKKK
ncbi:MAG: DUF4097 family beta strand repeat protein [Candidatus Aminicenantes bacterium]|nr:DUF4097 family beta strand repeat protein [Candidatus Aminicenantes bacterium]